MPSADLSVQAVYGAGEAPGAGASARYLILSSSLLIERMLVHTAFLDVLAETGPVTVWTMARKASAQTSQLPATIEPFPPVEPFRAFPYTYLRRMNEFAWDAMQGTPSRLSIDRHTRKYTPGIRMLKAPGRLLGRVGLAPILENRLERLMLAYPRSAEALTRLTQCPPSVLLVTSPFQFEQPAIVAAARQLGIPTIALIPSWDNISTKNRMVYKYDGYLVWSDWSKRELHEVYPHSRQVPVHVVGAAQFDVFFQDRFRQSREAFCLSQGLRPDRPIIVHAIGSPNFIREHPAALELAKRVVRGDLGDVQLIVRPHPIHDKAELGALFHPLRPRIVLQQTADPGVPLPARSQDHRQIVEWVNTFFHADVVVNLFSTVTVDAAIFDRPVVNLDYDPEPGQPNQALVKDVNHVWNHFKPVTESGGVWMAADDDEVVNGVRTYLAHPELHRNERRWITQHVCQYLDGRCSERMARAVADFASQQGAKHPRTTKVR